MRYLIISDIHGNAQALDAVLADAAAIGYDQTICLGDLVGYGADPGAVIQRVLALRPTAIVRGNHDKVAAGLEPSVLFNDMARRSIEWTHDVLSPGDLRILAELPQGPKLVEPGVEICHGSPFDEDHYVFEEADATRSIQTASAPWCFFGHTHLPAIFTSSDDPAARGATLADDELTMPRTGPALINVGSVGQPRDGDPRAAYGLLDVERRTIRLRRVPYDVAAAQQQIVRAGMPEWLAIRLERGQ